MKDEAWKTVKGTLETNINCGKAYEQTLGDGIVILSLCLFMCAERI